MLTISIHIMSGTSQARYKGDKNELTSLDTGATKSERCKFYASVVTFQVSKKCVSPEKLTKSMVISETLRHV